MVSTSIQPEDFFIYGNGKKLWVVMNKQIIEIKNYMIDSFNFSIDRGIEKMNFGDGSMMPICTRQTMEFDLHAIVADANMMVKDKVDVSDFYTIDEAKKLSKIIQRKFDKILETK